MINKDSKTVTIQVLNREYHIKCPKESIDDLKKSADYLDKKMREVHHVRGLKDKENTAIMAGLTITHDFLKNQQEYERTIAQMSEKIRHSLQSNENVD